MPLHLLGKKSWNVYNSENIARVKQDEAAAKAREDNEEQDRRSAAAATRLKALRGEDIPETTEYVTQSRDTLPSASRSRDTPRKRRKLAGEDDTDRDIRYARADRQTVSSPQRSGTNFDPCGHINFVSKHDDTKRPQRDPANNELGGMRFKDATGYKSDGKPWYTSKSTNQSHGSDVSKDVWGNEDPRRRERQQFRMNASDPLLAMKKGVKQLRENERQRQEWIEQREKDLYEVERLAKEERKKRRRSDGDEDSLDGFSLDATPCTRREANKDRKRDHKHDRHRRGSQSPDRCGHGHRHHRRHKHRTSEA